MNDILPVDLHERAVVRAMRAFFGADDALSLVAWLLELEYVGQTKEAKVTKQEKALVERCADRYGHVIFAGEDRGALASLVRRLDEDCELLRAAIRVLAEAVDGGARPPRSPSRRKNDE